MHKTSGVVHNLLKAVGCAGFLPPIHIVRNVGSDTQYAGGGHHYKTGHGERMGWTVISGH